VGATIEWLRARGHVYEGRLPPAEGAPIEDWEDREQTLFRATRLRRRRPTGADEVDGSYTYFASDIAYHTNPSSTRLCRHDSTCVGAITAAISALQAP